MLMFPQHVWSALSANAAANMFAPYLWTVANKNHIILGLILVHRAISGMATNNGISQYLSA